MRAVYQTSYQNKHNLIWFGGLNSDMHGTKAEAISEYADLNNYNFCRFDYSGHGLSSGNFEDCNISDWLNDSINILDNICNGQQIFIGSSMGGWISLLLALKRKNRVSGLVLIAPAVDMTEILMWNNFSDNEKNTINKKGKNMSIGGSRSKSKTSESGSSEYTPYAPASPHLDKIMADMGAFYDNPDNMKFMGGYDSSNYLTPYTANSPPAKGLEAVLSLT